MREREAVSVRKRAGVEKDKGMRERGGDGGQKRENGTSWREGKGGGGERR